MAQLWKVVGGADKGGVIVREGKALTSPQTEERLSTGATIEQIALEGDRLHYKRIEGSGPSQGWISTKLKDKVLAEKIENGSATSQTAEDGAIDEALKAKVAKSAETAGKDLPLWCMKYSAFYKWPLPTGTCKFRIFAFHNAGSAESVWTTPVKCDWNTWLKESKQVELVAVSYPGRDKLKEQKPIGSIDELTDAMLPVLYEKLTDGVPFGILSHSVGTWVSFTLLSKMRKMGLPMPKVAFFNAFPAPHMPEEKRPWRKQANLSDAEFAKEVKQWDDEHFGGVAKMVFDEPAWSDTWKPLMRADFQLFDEYRFTEGEVRPFSFPIHSFAYKNSANETPDMVELWKEWTTADFKFEVENEGGHLTCVYKPDLKTKYMNKVMQVFKTVSGVA